MAVKKIIVLGSTGSIGQNSLDVIRKNAQRFSVAGLSTKANLDLFNRQIAAFNPRAVTIADSDDPGAVCVRRSVPVYQGNGGLDRLVQTPAHVVINGLVGAVGIGPTYTAARLGRRIALANKESLVAAGRLIIDTAIKRGADIVPVDSEHSAIFQCLKAGKPREVEKLIITASGGPFRKTPAHRLRRITAKQALNHPTWRMGPKITVDSATLMNKGLEVIEAHFLFNVPYEKIDVVVHPQSIIHSMVQFVDGSVIAHLGVPDMRVPIQYALTYPDKTPLNIGRLDFPALGSLSFERPDYTRFPCLELAFAAGKTGGTLPCVMNAANEVAVDFFLKEKIGFTDIPRLIEKAMRRHVSRPRYSIDEILDLDCETRAKAVEWA
ncbi:MAG: 1-deoxy-D-xylulose-5-phosphate reductoisomerase [Candidatus Raymondbacteria bacterium RifOxyA12_full_50_37]|uniref:1-deoxy-D-xylulose 5-phosphate reductoisomerase n=1 Tax=Candidatus Raymondbacteria bacterium RIFOXYD12_FULL_49_13 TaxID=1817890 RepID=A0A1F7FAR6_UNCRA|nr:MAG: 1-deoxy-D-xylulose-5-phosphate reductoisomerase [Candidatus Raymondbacteria bacterium RifOxyA12_full_50_37]OGJ92393.1 MAG: 1-deoxy-D-xylulose-5-phosphate reductoisomerase [Candidatus Raymondbacteria bacterium RIFOXYA2_FULL_49_16]OGJ98760.1 MAG: 1-deoxy-D-xylulose-5-phosphate reductoisomerase [Candidatus Raymondbacteria bacterium RifOxyB12_full_50_8]OGJ99374.1 MAG: 1-deoxy-D-xylulose-5-phosphate reductoisomerase [Candidatus Raymondbacteria bacterium RIFOXYC2_FULL_50_21]OGK03612.1 MAG: 1-